MSLLGNIIWLIFGGFFASLGYIIGGFFLCLTIVGIPFGIQSIKLGLSSLAPFGKELVEHEEGTGCVRLFFDILWLVFFGWEIALLHIIHAAILAITIIGIPFAVQHIKLVPMSLFPLGRDLRKVD